jgi:Flp pilus assembly pilin Flp
MSVLTKALARVRRDEDGQSMIEYALLAFLIAIAAVVLLSVIGVDIAEVFDSVENNLGDDTAADDGTTPPGDDNADEATEAGGGA